ncbi:MAG TPA: type II toxin-antitoxin system HicA family toxin [Streptosporangiaceae bacterium]|nr:type II toxin-antitoxin system HicA family toxin [Streptosporangiaceae bacterium]
MRRPPDIPSSEPPSKCPIAALRPAWHQGGQALERAGFKLARISGSHHVMRHPDGRARANRPTGLTGRPRG